MASHEKKKTKAPLAQSLSITHIASQLGVQINVIIQNFDQTVTPSFASSNVYARMDPLFTYQNTVRKFTLQCKTDPNVSKQPATRDSINKLFQIMYPTFEKVPLVAADYPGFVANRILLPMINEAIETLFQGVGTVEAIDEMMKLGMGHPMGPLRLADFIGLDVCLSVLEVLHNGFGKDKYAPCPLLRNMVAAGNLGVKTKRGFYDYSENPKQPTPLSF